MVCKWLKPTTCVAKRLIALLLWERGLLKRRTDQLKDRREGGTDRAGNEE